MIDNIIKNIFDNDLKLKINNQLKENPTYINNFIKLFERCPKCCEPEFLCGYLKELNSIMYLSSDVYNFVEEMLKKIDAAK